MSKCWHTEYLNSNISIAPPISYIYFNVHCAKKQACDRDSCLVVRILIKELNHLLLIHGFINCYLFMWVKAVLRSEGERCGFWSTSWPMWSGLFGGRGLRFKEVECGSVVFCWMPKALAYYVKEWCSFSGSSLNLGRKGEKMASRFCKFFHSLMRLLDQCWGANSFLMLC